ncbi:hypothetical protein [Methanobacterium sp.]|uniref:hypothetical protein n=1 Tax=Methanobacterium sp. TaxID=2164 RepID=UPI002ABCFD92|nr:hypothetical protein [Methanobacterium sp.]MDY9923336.1 hypothetical protein [Methanobacterium sp.]
MKGFFEGEFLKIVDEKGKMVPSIGLFSLNYPTDEKKIIEWLRIQNGFFQCFSTSTYDPFRNDNYLLFEEEGREYNNYLIFSNRKDIDTSLFDDVDSSIKNLIKYCTLQIFALYRWAEIQEKLIGKLNTLTTKEILNLKKEDLNTIISNRKDLYKEMFIFERFKTEFKTYNVSFTECEFISIENRIKLHENLLENIKIKINRTLEIIETFEKHLNSILALKNVEFMKKNQEIVLGLTFVVIVLTEIQVGSALHII